MFCLVVLRVFVQSALFIADVRVGVVWGEFLRLNGVIWRLDDRGECVI